MKRYVVMHDWGCYEGWNIVGESDDLLGASILRENDLRNGGGRVTVFEVIALSDVYALWDRPVTSERLS